MVPEILELEMVAGQACARSAGLGVCFLCHPPPTFGPGPEGAAEGRQLDWEFAVYASRRRLRTSPGWGGGGAASLARSLLFYLSLTGLST